MGVPLVGITTYVEEAAWGPWRRPAALVPVRYVEVVAAAGGRPLLLPPVGVAVGRTLDVLDALVVAGGADLDPASYGAAPHPQTRDTRPQRDAAELALVGEAIERDVPVLGICRGAQVLNVARGGDLTQHLPDVVGHDGHRPAPGVFAAHEVTFTPSSRLASLLGARAVVQSAHHQGIGRLGDGLVASGRAPDGSIEAVELPGRRFVVGVLWHPEQDDDGRLFEALVEQARRRDGGVPDGEEARVR